MKARLKSADTRCMLWVALCFTLTSGVYLSWLDRLVSLLGAPGTDWSSMVAGYLLQAAGTGVVFLWLRKRLDGNHGRAFLAAVLLLIAVSVPALITDSVFGVVVFGLLMNGLCGAISGFYLFGIGIRVRENRRSVVFGCGYAVAVVAVGLLALVGNGALLHGRFAPVFFVLVTAGLAGLTAAFRPLSPAEAGPSSVSTLDRRQVLSALGVVLLISLVKNLGYGFPSSDIQTGIVPEISRIPYAAGLVAAGLISAKSRRNGMLCTVAALIIPFLMLGLTHEPVSGAIFWGLDYVFFAFFSVFRVVLFLDLAGHSGHWELAPLGLLAGRIGDAAGTAVYLALSGSRIVLIGITAALFIPAVFLLFRLYENLYDLKAVQARLEREKFRTFCVSHDFSAREQDIFRLLIGNKTNGEIAGALFISENTVKYHVKNILQKSGCRNRIDLQRKYEGLTDSVGKAETGEEEKPKLHIVS